MNKKLLLFLVCLSVALAYCNSSCNCNPNSNVCISCKDPNSVMDGNHRSCYCKAGYYTGDVNPFKCDEFVKDTSGDEDTSEQIMDPCQIEIGIKTPDVKIATDCRFEMEGINTFVKLTFGLDFSKAEMDDTCKAQYKTLISYSKVKDVWIDLPLKYITNLPNGGKTMKIPLIDVYDLCFDQSVNDLQITQTIKLRAKIGSPVRYLRTHKWDVIVYTNRDQVEVFTIDVDVQETEGCQPGQECIVIADLDTNSQICTDSSCAAVRPNNKYLVGDIFYAKVWFADATYKKKLTFESLYFKTDSNKIFNFSGITTHNSQIDALYFQLPLVQPSQGAVIQINMKINPVSRFRALEESSTDSKKQFTVNIDQPADNSANAQSSFSINMVFGLLNLIAVILMF